MIDGGANGAWLIEATDAINQNSGKLAILAGFLAVVGSAFALAIPVIGSIALIGVFISLLVVWAQLNQYIIENNECVKNGGSFMMGSIATAFASLALAKLGSLGATIGNFIAKGAIGATLCNGSK